MSETYLYNHKKSKNAKLNVWMAFPGIYSFGMSSLGFLNIYKSINLIPDIYAEKIFTDTKDNNLKPSEVDVLGFSFSFELNATTILKMLKKYNIPYKAKDRDENFPLIYAGGPVVTANPEPFALFFDFIMVGDFENEGKNLFETLRDNKHLCKKELLQKLSTIPGVYVPSLTKFDVKTNSVTTLDNKPFQIEKTTAELSDCVYTPILSDESYFSNTFIIEIQRGCPQKCGFCLASYINLPPRTYDYDNLTKTIEFGLQYTDKIAFLGPLVASHPRFDNLCDYIIKKIDDGKHIELSMSSLRADTVSPKTIEMLVKCGQKTATIAVEAGSERLRKVINKNLSEGQIIKMIDIAKTNGLKGLKIYAMIGLPTETYEDLEQLIEFTKKIKKQFKNFDISYSFATFVPKAQTPFQYCERESTKSLEKKYEYLKKEFHKIGIKISCSSVKWDYIQSLLSRGDRRLTDYIIDVFEAGEKIGCYKNIYKEYKKQKKLPDADIFAIRSINPDKNIPWGFIKTQENTEFLAKEYNRLLRLS